MVPSMRPTGLLLTFLLMAVGATSVEGKRCPPPYAQMPGTPPGEQVYLLDGSVVPGGLAEWKIIGLAEWTLIREGLDPDARLRGIICWNPTTGKFARGGNGVPAINVWLILPKQLVGSTRGPIEELLLAQDAHFAQASRAMREWYDWSFAIRFGVKCSSATSVGVQGFER